MKFGKYLQESSKSIADDFIGKQIKNVSYPRLRGVVMLSFMDKTKIEISCFGGNSITVEDRSESISEKKFQMLAKGRYVKKINFSDPYELKITLDNGKSISFVDDTGGEGVEISEV